ncbi:hypothetical protein T492DRAFT_896232 [Pavlovales sp. CCMP2436]|nr:hypothetical protein T492DRAFT_896232 [Pavlovales sp. CCMP2436]
MHKIARIACIQKTNKTKTKTNKKKEPTKEVIMDLTMCFALTTTNTQCRNKVNEGDDYCTRHKKVVERLKKETELKDENDVALKDKNETIAILRREIELAESKTQEAIRNMEALAEMKTMRAIREMEGRELTAQLAGMYMGTSSMSQ